MNWKDLFYKDSSKESTPAVVESTPLPVNVPVNVPSSIPGSSTLGSTSPVEIKPGEVSKELVDYFDKVFTERNLPGPDFYEFFQALSKMSEMNVDEATMYKMAFMSLSTMGVTKQTLIDTAGTYIQTAKEKHSAFLQTIKAKTDDADKVVQQARKEAQTIEAQLKELQSRLEAANSTVAKAEADKAQYPAKLAAFEAALNMFTSGISQTCERIRTHIS